MPAPDSELGDANDPFYVDPASPSEFSYGEGHPEHARDRLCCRATVTGIIVFLLAAAATTVLCIYVGVIHASWAVPTGVILVLLAVWLSVRCDQLGARGIALLWACYCAFRDYRAVQERETKRKRKWRKPKKEWATIFKAEYDNVPKAVEEATDADWAEVHERNAVRLRDTAMEYKGLWIKLCQYLASRQDFVPPIYVQKLKVFEDSQPPRPFKETEETIRNSLGPGVLCDIQQPPLSVASIGSVYRATLKATGEAVVVKVLHKGVARLLMLDSDVILYVLQVVARREPQWDFCAFLNEWLREAPQEVDFRYEARSVERVARSLKKVASLPDPFGFRYELPRVMHPHVSQKVLVLSWVGAKRLREFAKEVPEGVDLIRTARDIVRAMCTQIFVDGYFNADPHPGNFLVHPDGTPVLLDFGLCKRYTASFRQTLSSTIVYADAWNQEGIEKAFGDMGLKLKDPAYNLWLVPAVLLHWDTRRVEEKFGELRRERHAARTEEQKREERQRQEEIKDKGLFESFPDQYVLYQRSTELLRGVAVLLGWQGSLLPTVLPFARAGAGGYHPSDPSALADERRRQSVHRLQLELGDLLQKTKPLLLELYNCDPRFLPFVRHHAPAPDAVTATAVDVSLERVTATVADAAGKERSAFVRFPARAAGITELQAAVEAMFDEAGCGDMVLGEEHKMAMMRACFKHPDEFRVLEQARQRLQEERAEEAASASSHAAEEHHSHGGSETYLSGADNRPEGQHR
eukprot:TRINITY_DN61525_c0_g1_i1.p1 TRINITY_DN61525_c0_g1~~TRINITY_DN61525_c0_g1_i1.p1  ORF type:complete len:773 (+),score=258.83 TRINITY_DN61525_c0_g1_i1:73-2319(+)